MMKNQFELKSNNAEYQQLEVNADDLVEDEDVVVNTERDDYLQNIGLLLMAFSALLFSLMSLLVKIGSMQTDQYPFGFVFTELVFARSFVQMLISLLYLLTIVRINPFGPDESQVRLLLILRGSSGAVGTALFVLAIAILPLSDATTFFFTGPPITALVAYVWLKEPYSRCDALAAVLCMFGVILVSRPQFIFGDNQVTNQHTYLPKWIGILSALVGAVFSAVAYCSVRKVGAVAPGRVHAMVHVFYFGFISTIVSGVLMAIQWRELKLPRLAIEWLLLAAIGVCASGAQFLLNTGLQMATAGPATLVRMLDLVFAFIYSGLVLHDAPDNISVLMTNIAGAVLICAGASTSALVKWLAKRQEKRRLSN